LESGTGACPLRLAFRRDLACVVCVQIEKMTDLRVMAERPRLLVLDLLESYARERNIDVRLERRHDLNRWLCVLSGPPGQGFVRGSGRTAREAVRDALKQAGVENLSD
jgi:hypothetical protein